jgi:hypothetical protein
MNSQPLQNPSPKRRFLETPANVHGHRALIDLPQFEHSADAAMLEYCSLIASQVKDGNSAMAAGFKLQGAFEHAQTFRMISETFKVSQPVISDNLPSARQ